ncbi:S1 family peptidase [Brevibacillus sp. NRS-1366]|uniref:S1 family peptidase n=1 Tax=Brevibacillus sp. NRS-1366 TaxID=3233899 RepID=UPI003D215129
MKKLGTSLLVAALLATTVVTFSIPATSTLAAQKQNLELEDYILSKDVVQESEKFREEMGLSLKNLKSLSDDPTNFSEKYGIFLTKKEEKELDKRLEEQKIHIPKIKDYIEKHLKDEFAAIYIDQKSGGVVNIGFKTGSEESVKKFEKDLKKLYSKGMVEIYYTDYTEEQLDKIAESVSEKRDELAEKGLDLSSVSVNIPEQKIDIGVAKKKDVARSLLLDTDSVSDLDLDIDSNLVNIFEEDVREAQASVSDKFRPIQAGLRIDDMDDGGYCTSAFSAQIGTKFYVLTAGHCIGTNTDRWSQGGSRFGRSTDYNFGGNVDAAIIKLDDGSDDATYYLFGNSKSKLYAIDEVQKTKNETVGDAVCISGAKTQVVKCGTLQTKNWSGYSDQTYLSGMRQASYESAKGDSGAPIFLGGTAIGVHSSSGGIYSHITRVINYFDIDDIFIGN